GWLRQETGHLVGDVAVIGIEPVEGVVDAVEGADEVRRTVRVVRVVDAREAHDRVGLVPVRRPLHRDGDWHLAVTVLGQGAELHHAMPGPHHRERQLLRLVAAAGCRHRDTLVVRERLDRHALRRTGGVVDVAGRPDGRRGAVWVAQALHDAVDVVAAGARRGPRVVLTVAELDDELRAGEGDAARVDARALQRHL